MRKKILNILADRREGISFVVLLDVRHFCRLHSDNHPGQLLPYFLTGLTFSILLAVLNVCIQRSFLFFISGLRLAGSKIFLL